jgi:hypothetical protein
MSKKSDQLSTNLEDYVRARYPDLAALFDYCKLFNLLMPRANGAGVTLLVPTDKTYLNSLRELSTSSSAAQVTKACDSLLSLIMRRVITSAAEWASPDISDMRWPAQAVVGRVASKGVELVHDGKAYATVRQDSDFKLGYQTRKIAVWLLDGKMREQMDADAQTRPQRPRGSRRVKRTGPTGGSVEGGYDVSATQVNTNRFKIAISAENEFVIQHMKSGGSAPSATTCPFLSYTFSFARFAYAKAPEIFYERILPVLRYRVTDFYAIFESHRFAAEYLVPDALINEWWDSFNVASAVQTDVLAFRDWIDSLLTGEAKTKVPCAIYSQPEELAEAIDAIRADITGQLGNNQRIPEFVYKIYDTVINQNAVGSIANVFPPGIHRYYSSNPRMKEMHDELAFVIEPLMIRVCQRFDLARFRTIIAMIGNAMHAITPAEIEAKLPLVNATKIGLLGGNIVKEIAVFINSTMFLWHPITKAMMKNHPIESSPTRTSDDALFNTDLALALHHERIYADMSAKIADANQAIALKALESIGPGHMSAELQAKIKTLAQQS